MPTILDEILAVKRDEVAALRSRQGEFEAACRDAPPVRSLAEALRRRGEGQSAIRNPQSAIAGPIRILAEVKHRSPSAGVICDPFEPSRIARTYEAGGADAVSCLTDERFFGGSIAHLREVRAAVDLPILRKEFIIDEVQVFEARAAGADAVLLIAEALQPQEMVDLAATARGIGMDVLAEVHSEAMLERAIACGAPLVGINNRDLATFTVDLQATERLAPRVREAGRVLVAESGIKTAADVSRLLACGCDAILVGEGLLRSGDVAGTLAEFKSAT
ncbi:MAG: indole-3-glycerol phosphate synthase TrpC [Phycisphaerae bacterium]